MSKIVNLINIYCAFGQIDAGLSVRVQHISESQYSRSAPNTRIHDVLSQYRLKSHSPKVLGAAKKASCQEIKWQARNQVNR